ncbi:c-type cytochrome [Gayadomonas joobiniege]|uniref:c-type cytochrome n=1 Tax=Gayadomonas joobiniege TaxID=1234606 RepID=UPI000379BFF6|nr:c-type cytochrome [Gayadomonas joobiniege]
MRCSIRLIASLAIFLVCSAFAHSSDEELNALSLKPDVNKKGQSLYLSFCAGCHKKDLSGAVGFNLKDGEWIHGDKPTDILRNLQNGFSSAGMPGFKNAISLADQKAIVAYILSKREGFEQLTYQLYQLDSDDDYKIESKDIVASGRLKNNYLDFELPEIKHYMIEFSGQFHAPKDQPSFLYAEKAAGVRLELLVNGKAAKVSKYADVQRWPLLPGKQALTLRFYSNHAKAWVRNPAVYVTNAKDKIKLFPVSLRALAQSKDATFEVKAESAYLVEQKKIINLPPYSIAVGAPQKVNFSFNSRSCAVNALWLGDLLNIGPNIGGRGKDGSIPLGDWLYHSPQVLQPKIADGQVCQFIKYRLQGSPEFYFSLNGLQLKLVADTQVAEQITFNYFVLANPQEVTQLSFELPKVQANKLSVSSQEAVLTNERLQFDINKHAKFSINMAW